MMKGKIFILLSILCSFSGCAPWGDAPCKNEPVVGIMDKDLVVETDRHVVVVAGQPDKDYRYYVWTGDKDYSDTPDFAIDTRSE